jgi:putative tricarboxylic transport membrane protein
MDTLYASEEWKAVMKSNGLIPFHPKAGEFESFVTNQVQDIEDLSREIGLLK